MNELYVHPNSLVETQQIGEGTRVWAFTHVMQGVVIGMNCNIGEHCFIESGVVIGNNVTIKNGNMLWDGVILEDGVFVGPHVSFMNDLYPRSPRLPQARRRYSTRGWLVPTHVCAGASLGAGAVILAGISVGAFCMLGAGAVVVQDVASYALVVGNPARLRGWVCQCGQPLDFHEGIAVCGDCRLEYAHSGDSIQLTSARQVTEGSLPELR
jgi:acetyltransferase-like isoleucine patch superfamily enzyme